MFLLNHAGSGTEMISAASWIIASSVKPGQLQPVLIKHLCNVRSRTPRPDASLRGNRLHESPDRYILLPATALGSALSPQSYPMDGTGTPGSVQ